MVTSTYTHVHICYVLTILNCKKRQSRLGGEIMTEDLFKKCPLSLQGLKQNKTQNLYSKYRRDDSLLNLTHNCL